MAMSTNQAAQRAVPKNDAMATASAVIAARPDGLPAESAPRWLVEFVLDHTRVQTNVCSLQDHRVGYRLAPRRIPDHNLIYVLEHHAVWVLEDTPYELAPGHLLIVPPRMWHHGYSTEKSVTIFSVHLEMTLPGGQDVFDMLSFPRMQQVLPASSLDGYLTGAANEFHRSSENERLLMLPNWGRMIGLELIIDNHRRGWLQHRVTDPLVAEILEELRRRADRPVRLGDLARWSGYSPQHINRVFRKVLGVTPLQHHLRLRMDRAAETLLDNPNTRIATVARLLGFADPFHFSRLFRKVHGRSPTQFLAAARSCDCPRRAFPP